MVTPPQEPLADPITELRRLTDALLDRLQPWLDTLDTHRAQPTTPNGDAGPDPTPPPSQGRCPCPLCALQTAVRGNRTGLTHRLTDHGITALATLRELLLHDPDHPGDPAPQNAAADPAAPTSVTHQAGNAIPFAPVYNGPSLLVRRTPGAPHPRPTTQQ